MKIVTSFGNCFFGLYRRIFHKSRTVVLNTELISEPSEPSEPSEEEEELEAEKSDEEDEHPKKEVEDEDEKKKKDDDGITEINTDGVDIGKEVVRSIAISDDDSNNVKPGVKRVKFCEVKTLYYYEKREKKEERSISSGCDCNGSIDGCTENCECVQAGIPCVDGCSCGVQAQCKSCEHNHYAKCYQYHSTKCGNISKKSNHYHVKQRLEFDHNKLCVLWEMRVYDEKHFFDDSQIKEFVPVDYEFESEEVFKDYESTSDSSSAPDCSTDGSSFV